MQKQQGFTLIELMIVVAIIGILAAIAIPQYQNYVARSQMSEAFTLTGGLKTDVVSHYAETGSCPTNSSGQFGAPGDYSGTYVAQVDLGNSGTAGECTIEATMKAASGNDINASIAGKKLKLTMTDNSASGGATSGSTSWVCTSDADPQYLPNSCS